MFSLLLLAWLLPSAYLEPVSAQTRRLPKARFPVFTRPSGQGESDLPTSFGGVHLTDGLDRPADGPNRPYNPGEPDLNMQLVRWEKKKMPLLIWIGPGIMLPACPYSQIKNTRVDFVYDLLKQPDPFVGLPQAPEWTQDVNYRVAAGIEEWRQFEKEGLFSFAFTDDPKAAHILVFFTDAFREDNSPGGIAIGGITSAQVFPFAQAQKVNIPQKPVIIELATQVNYTEEKMIPAAAHEFGHALGIKAHSPYRQDLMYVDRVAQHLSPADKATIRALYRAQPQWVM